MVAWRTTIVLPFVASARGRAALLLFGARPQRIAIAGEGPPWTEDGIQPPYHIATVSHVRNEGRPVGCPRARLGVSSPSRRDPPRLLAPPRHILSLLVETFGVETSLP